jgi:hypothetical protein
MKENIVEGIKLYNLAGIVGIEIGNDGNEQWIIPKDTIKGKYLIKVNCALGFYFTDGCNAGRSGVFTIK